MTDERPIAEVLADVTALGHVVFAHDGQSATIAPRPGADDLPPALEAEFWRRQGEMADHLRTLEALRPIEHQAAIDSIADTWHENRTPEQRAADLAKYDQLDAAMRDDPDDDA